VRFNGNQTIGKCGHMIDAPGFGSWNEMQTSLWLKNIRDMMLKDQWPKECRRCQITENVNGQSIRKASMDRHNILVNLKSDYVILGGVLDNVCNSACQSCNDTLSTKIGSLASKNFIKIDNTSLLSQIPMEQVVELDINGGEPTASPRYRDLLSRLPDSVKIVRINTNGSRILPHIETLLQKKIKVIITLSLDGVDKIHDYVRWPILWQQFIATVEKYIKLRNSYSNLKLQFWTVFHALNLSDYGNIKQYAEEKNIEHSWAFLEKPDALNPIYCNNFTVSAKKTLPNNMAEHVAIEQNNQMQLDTYINEQDQLRKINIRDYL
jgi:sulfatase maturation enzyme AslB (radical SAM superfamily)